MQPRRSLVEGRSAHDIFGDPDELKFHSSMTLFANVATDERAFEEALEKFFDGRPDALTLQNWRSWMTARRASSAVHLRHDHVAFGGITSEEKSCSHVYLQAVHWPSSSAPALCCWPRRLPKPRCRRLPARHIRLPTSRRPGARPVFTSARWALALLAARARAAAIIIAAGSTVGAVGSAIDRIAPIILNRRGIRRFRGHIKTAAGTISGGREFSAAILRSFCSGGRFSSPASRKPVDSAEAHPLRRPSGPAADSRRSWAISCKASAYFVNSLATHVRAALSSQALIALWASRETNSTVGFARFEIAGNFAELVAGRPDRPSKDCAETDETDPNEPRTQGRRR